MMSSAPRTKEDIHVVYSGSVQIPICIGSVAIPLASSSLHSSCVASPTSKTESNAKNASFAKSHTSNSETITLASSHLQARSARSSRCTHQRYCYIRDGSAIEQDAFYRWLQYSTKTLTKAKTNHVKRQREISDNLKKNSNNVEENSTNGMNNVIEESSPSLFYAIIDHVVFTMPRSFPSPRRVIRSAPFVIVDDAWAAHSIDIQIHFMPFLAIPPLTFVHVVHLHRLLEITPKLLSVHHGEWTPCNFYAVQPIKTHHINNNNESIQKQVSSSSFTVSSAAATSKTIITETHEQENKETSPKELAQPKEYKATELLVEVNEAVNAANEVVVMERKDAIRIFHPTLHVVEFVQCILRKSNAPVIESLRLHFVQNVYPQCILHNSCNLLNHTETNNECTTSQNFDTNDKCVKWMLPNEKEIADYAQKRPERANKMLRQVLHNLQEEQNSLWTQLTTSLRNISDDVKRVHSKLDDIHQLCTTLQRERLK